MTRAELEEITQRFWKRVDGKSRLRLFAVLDAARAGEIYPALLSTDLHYRCLYRGELPSTLAKVAPYLVRLPFDSAFLDFLANRGWGDSWGLFIISTSQIDPLRQHLRRFLRVKDEGGRTLLFRYYDPRVMRIFLPTCDSKQLELLYAELESFVIEDQDGEGATEFNLVDSELHCTPFGEEMKSR